LPPALHLDPDTVAFLRAAGCVYAQEEAQILTDAAASAEELRVFLHRRATGEPLEYIVGWAEYCGLRVSLCTGVFVPRRRSEFLAECGVRAVRTVAAREGRSRRVKALDMCCGSGAIGLALAARSGNVELLAADDSSIAVGCARQNLVRVGGRVYLGDLFAALPQTDLHSLDLIVASAPYVPTAEVRGLPAEARLYEPMSTLDGGPDGTSVQRRILESAGEWLGSPGLVIIETGGDMADVTARIARDSGFTAEIRRCAELDATVIVATQRGQV
jgi:release factor glutamine methyltransferase